MAQKGLTYWIKKLSQQEMPVMSNVFKELNELTGSEETEVNQLADVILKDANLTSQVLRIANSVHYNHSGYPINTVSRAIVLIGFNGVRAICLSVMMIDTLLKNEPRERLLGVMARAFHAAVQARNMVKRTNDNVKEEVFIAALLYHIGDMAVWAAGGESADELDEALNMDANLRAASQSILGTSIKSITRELVDVWKLGDTLRESIGAEKPSNPKVVAVRLGEELSRIAENGWSSSEVGDVVAKVSRFTGLSFPEAQKMAMEGADEAASVALTYGAAKVCHLIPSSKFKGEATVKEEPKYLKPDPQLQLSILRELNNALTERVDVNTLFQMVIEGMHRGVGLERVCVAFVMKNEVQCKYALGEGTELWRTNFRFPTHAHLDNVFTYTIQKKEPVWINDDCKTRLKHLYAPEFTQVVGRYPSFSSVVEVNGRNVAIIYADRWNLGGNLTEEQFESFRHFVQQAVINLEALSRQK